MTDWPVIVFAVGDLSDRKPTFIRADETVELRSSVGEAIPKWVQLLPTPLDYDNTDVCSPSSGPDCSVDIEWAWTEITEWHGKTTIRLNDNVPPLALGTHRIAVVSGALPSPKPENTLEIVVRRDDTYVGYSTELIGTPFVFWPKQIEHGHQTDLRLGADCSATVIYGKRRMGHSVGYVAPKGLLRYLEVVDSNSVQVGDVLHFGFQTALLSQDTAPLGVLNDSDLILHSHHQLVEEIPLQDASYAEQPFKVYRWMELFQE
ncbi:MAG: hypothetical protein ACON4U_18390 [Myxococcota bacterium]